MFWARKFNAMFTGTKTSFQCRKNHPSRSNTSNTITNLLTVYIAYVRSRTKWAGALKSILIIVGRVQERAKMLINNGRISKAIVSLKHSHNVACVLLFYCYYNGSYSNEKKELVLEYHVFKSNICLSRWLHPFLTDWPMDCTLYYKQNCHTISVRKDLPVKRIKSSSRKY